jgi:transcriptional regulator with XRE-family HTH domain
MQVEAAQFLRALRGQRSQHGLAKRLGYRGNPITNWECAHRFPTAAEALRVAAAQKRDVQAAVRAFSPSAPLPHVDGAFCVGAWLNALRAKTPIKELAERSGHSRFSVMRWLNGQAEPRLPDFFRVLDAITGRLPEWVAEFVAIENVPSLQLRYHQAQAARQVAFEAPWSEAVLRLLESRTYRSFAEHRDGWLAARLGLSLGEEAQCLQLLKTAGLINEQAGRLAVNTVKITDTKGGQGGLLNLKRHWCEAAAARLTQPTQEHDLFAYNVFSVSAADYQRIRGLLRGVFREIRSVVAASEPEDTVAVINIQAFRLFVDSEPPVA